MIPETAGEHTGHSPHSLLEYVEQFTELEPLGTIRGSGGWYHTTCVLPSCEDTAQSLYVFSESNQEGFKCYECGRDGGMDEFRAAKEGADVVSIARNRNRNLGNKVVSYDPERSIRAVSFRGREKPGPREWIVDRAVCEGHPASWYGESGVAKSLLAAHMGLHIAGDGVDYWAGLRVKTMPVVYGDFELDEVEHLRRAQELAAGMGLPDVPAKFHYLSLAGLPAAEAFMIAAEECQRLEAGLFIVDSVGFALDGDSELAKDVLKFFRECIQPIREAGATPLLIDHQAKVIKGEKYSDKQAFGSVYKTNAARSSFQIRGSWDGNELAATFTHKKTNFGPKVDDFSLKLVFGAGRIEVTRLADAVANPDREPSKKVQVYEAFKEMRRGTSETVARKAGIPIQTVRNSIAELVSEGLLEDTGEKQERYSVFVVTHNQTTKGTVTVTKGSEGPNERAWRERQAAWREEN
jgi:AAA domain